MAYLAKTQEGTGLPRRVTHAVTQRQPRPLLRLDQKLAAHRTAGQAHRPSPAAFEPVHTDKRFTNTVNLSYQIHCRDRTDTRIGHE